MDVGPPEVGLGNSGLVKSRLDTDARYQEFLAVDLARAAHEIEPPLRSLLDHPIGR
jgi:hypothetical protein